MGKTIKYIVNIALFNPTTGENTITYLPKCSAITQLGKIDFEHPNMQFLTPN
jgi:hypothetical protein